MNKLISKKQSGFTLIELLVVIAILGVLLAIVLVAVNPQQNFRQANNTQRKADTNTLLNAISQYVTQNNGQLPAGITSTAKTISSTTGATTIDLCAVLVPTFVADLPLDPTAGTETPAGSVCTDASAEYDTGYTVQSSAGSRVTVTAPSAEDGEVISVSR